MRVHGKYILRMIRGKINGKKITGTKYHAMCAHHRQMSRIKCATEMISSSTGNELDQSAGKNESNSKSIADTR